MIPQMVYTSNEDNECPLTELGTCLIVCIRDDENETLLEEKNISSN